jgi:endonuclease III related protein
MNSYTVYQQLLDHYGPQGWWPLLQRSSRPGYKGDGYHPGLYELELQSSEQFEIISGAILTQNTSWKNVRSSLIKLLDAARRRNFAFGPEFVLRLEVDELAELIRSSGYYNQKAKKLRYMAEFCRDGVSKAGPSRSEMLSLWGIGPETADSILLYVYNRPVCVVDAYSMRIFKRLEGTQLKAKWSYEDLQAAFHRHLPADRQVYNEFHALLVAHAKQHCTSKNPKCYKCPLKTDCTFLAQNG